MRTPLLTLTPLALTGCLNPAGPFEQRPSLFVSGIVADSFEIDQDPLPVGATIGDAVDPTGFEVGLGLTTTEWVGPPPGAPPGSGPTFRRKVSRFDAALGVVEFEDGAGTRLSAIDLSAGARAYTPINAGVAPYAGVRAVATLYEERVGSSIGVQLGLRPALGVEVDLTRWLALDLGVDYTLPLFTLGPGEVLGVDADTTFEGLLGRVGLIVSL